MPVASPETGAYSGTPVSPYTSSTGGTSTTNECYIAQPYFTLPQVEAFTERLKRTKGSFVLSVNRESELRANASKFAWDLCVYLRFPIRTYCTAMTIYNRFHLFNYIGDFDYRVSCLYIFKDCYNANI